jgi:hypothetical protein
LDYEIQHLTSPGLDFEKLAEKTEGRLVALFNRQGRQEKLHFMDVPLWGKG